jgi:hypothetical protein
VGIKIPLEAFSTDLVVLGRRIDALAPADNLVDAAEDGVRITPVGKDVLVHLFAQKEGGTGRY